MKKYFKTSDKYFKFINHYKDIYKIKKVYITNRNYVVIYEI